MPTQIVPEISRQLAQAYERTQRELASDEQMASQVWDEALTKLQGFEPSDSDATPQQFVEAHAAVSILEQVLTSVSGRSQLFTNGNTT